VGVWETPIGGLVLNLSASVLWDGSKAAFAVGRKWSRDRHRLAELAGSIEAHASVSVPTEVLADWLADEGFWLDLVALCGRVSKPEGFLEAIGRRCGIQDSEIAAKVLAVVQFEIGRSDTVLRARLHEARVEHKLDVLEHSLGYVLEEVLGAVYALHNRVDELGSSVTAEFRETRASIAELGRRFSSGDQSMMDLSSSSRRVFVSHTAELGRLPVNRSFVQAAKDAIVKARMVPVEQSDLPSGGNIAELVAGCDVWVGIIGHRYGTPVPSQLDRSYVEWEHEIAMGRGCFRVPLLLKDSVCGSDFDEPTLDYRERQVAFRQRLWDGSETSLAKHFESTAEVELLVYQTLVDQFLGHRASIGGTVRRSSLTTRSTVPALARGWVHRPRLTEAIVGKLCDGESLVSLAGSGGVGKTVLAQQTGAAESIVHAHPGGVFWQTVGEYPEAQVRAAYVERVAVSLVRQMTNDRITGTGTALAQLRDVCPEHRTLVILDDVWPPIAAIEPLLASFPANVAVLLTTRGAVPSGGCRIAVGELDPSEARRILAGEACDSWPTSALEAVDELAIQLGQWPLLIDMAARLLQDYRDEPDDFATYAAQIAADFGFDKTVLDDPESRSRSIEWIAQRSLDAIDEVYRDRFRLLAVYPRDAVLTVELLGDLWATTLTETLRTIQRLDHVGLVTRYALAGSASSHIRLHDLVVDLLHGWFGGPGTLPGIHLRCAARSVGERGSPGALSPARATWLAYHLIHANEWGQLDRLASREWRSAYLRVTGSDAIFLDQLTRYEAAATRLPDEKGGAYHQARAIYATALVNEFVSRVPIDILVTDALLGSPLTALAQASRNGDAANAITSIHAALPDLTDDALTAASSIPDRDVVDDSLVGISQTVASRDPRRAVGITEAISDDALRSQALARIAAVVARADVAQARSLLQAATRLADGTADDTRRTSALCEIAVATAHLDPTEALNIARSLSDGFWTGHGAQSEAIERIASIVGESDVQQSLAIAKSIPDSVFGGRRAQAIASVAARLALVDLEAALAVAESIPENVLSKARADAFFGIALAVAAKHPDAALEIVSNWPSGASLPTPRLGLDAHQAVLIEVAGALAVSAPARAEALWNRVLWHVDADMVFDPNAAIVLLARIARVMASSDPGRSKELLRRAVGLAEVSAFEDLDPCLVNFACSLAPQRADQALDVIRMISADTARERALVNTTLALPISKFELALELCAGLSDDSRSLVFAGLAPKIASEDLDRALTMASAFPATTRCIVLAGIAAAIAATDPHQADSLVNEAIAIANTLDDGFLGVPGRATSRSSVGIIVALSLFDLDRALALAACLENEVDQHQTEALAGIVEGLAILDPQRALEIASELPDDGLDSAKARALAAISEGLAWTNPDQAVDIASRILEGGFGSGLLREATLAEIAFALQTSDPERSMAILDDLSEDLQLITAARVAAWQGWRDPMMEVLALCRTSAARAVNALAAALKDANEVGELLDQVVEAASRTLADFLSTETRLAP
jgi:hypothetical protein